MDIHLLRVDYEKFCGNRGEETSGSIRVRVHTDKPTLALGLTRSDLSRFFPEKNRLVESQWTPLSWPRRGGARV